MENDKNLDDSCNEDSCGCGHDHGEEDHGEMKVDFFNYIASMGYQAMIFLGEVPNPITQETDQNLRQAKFLIDTLALVREKTKGNLTPPEDQFISSTLYELQMKYVDCSSKGKLI